MVPFDLVYPELAQRDAILLARRGSSSSPDAMLWLREHYCNIRGCDCRRVLLQAIWVDHECVVATIGYGFERSRLGIPQILLDPLHPQSDDSASILEVFEKLVAREPAIRERFIRHYRMWKRAVDDPGHPDHCKVHARSSRVPGAFQERPPFPPNQRCPCRSGRKYKNCCGTRQVGETT